MDSYKEVKIMQENWYNITSIAFSPDCKYLVFCSNDNKVKLWNVKTYKKVATLRGHRREVVSVAFSADGKYLATGSLDDSIKLWSIESL